MTSGYEPIPLKKDTALGLQLAYRPPAPAGKPKKKPPLKHQKSLLPPAADATPATPTRPKPPRHDFT